MGRWKPLGKEAEDYLAFPLLVALSRRPFSDKELAHVLQISQDSVRRRAKGLEALGYVVKRKKDSRWVMVVRLMAIGAPEPSGVPGVTPGAAEEPIADTVTVGNVVLAPQEPPRPTQQERAEQQATAPPSRDSQGILGAASRKWALRFSVPETLEGRGELTIGALLPCIHCTVGTPLKYGSVSVCARCARVWGDVVGRSRDLEGVKSNVHNETRGTAGEDSEHLPPGAGDDERSRDVLPDDRGAGDEGGEGRGADGGV